MGNSSILNSFKKGEVHNANNTALRVFGARPSNNSEPDSFRDIPLKKKILRSMNMSRPETSENDVVYFCHPIYGEVRVGVPR